MRFIKSLTLVMLMAACSEPQDAPTPAVILDAPALIGEDRAKVDEMLGAPICNQESQGLACDYDENTSVYFVDGMAANLTLAPAKDMRVYALELGEPAFREDDMTRWDIMIGGKPAEVSRFTDYVYVKTQ